MRLPFCRLTSSLRRPAGPLPRCGKFLLLLALATLPSTLAAQGGGGGVMAAPVVYVPDVNLRGLPAADEALGRQREAYTESFAYALNSGVCGRLETADDLRRRLTNQAILQALGSDDGTAETQGRIAAAVNADHLGLASIGRVGNALVVNASLVEVRGGRVVARATAKASSPAQLTAALRTVGRQLSQSAGWRAPADVMLTARQRILSHARGMEEAGVLLDGAVYISDDAIRTELSGASAAMFQLATIALSGDSTMTAVGAGIWMLTKVSTGEITVVNDGNRTVLPLLTDGVVDYLGTMIENSAKAVPVFDKFAREVGKLMGMSDRGETRMVVERMDVGASRIQDSVWVGMNTECTAAAQQAASAPGARVRCASGQMQVRVAGAERTQGDRVNGFTVEHWQVRHDVRARLEGGPDVTSFTGQSRAEVDRERRMDDRTTTDFWVPRGAGFCLPTISTATADPLEKSLATYDKMANAQLATEFSRAMAALRAVPGGATRTVMRIWGADVQSADPVVTHQIDITDVRQLPKDASRFAAPAGYRRLTLPQLPKIGDLRAGAAAGEDGRASAGAASGASAGRGGQGAAAGGAPVDRAKGDGDKGDGDKDESLGDKAARAVKGEAKETADEVKADAKAEVREKVDEAKAKAKQAVTGRFKGLLKKAGKDSGGR